jgi:hypothetical protein
VAAQDLRLMNPAALAENHPNCRKNDAGEPLLPNGTPWRQQLLMLGLSSKLLVDAEKALDIRKVNLESRTLKVRVWGCGSMVVALMLGTATLYSPSYHTFTKEYQAQNRRNMPGCVQVSQRGNTGELPCVFCPLPTLLFELHQSYSVVTTQSAW